MIEVTDLPTVNAVLNGVAAVLLSLGYLHIRARRIDAHRRTMLAAFACSVLFRASYLFYHYKVGSVRFPGTGTVRTVYLTILASHTVLAATVPFLAIAQGRNLHLPFGTYFTHHFGEAPQLRRSYVALWGDPLQQSLGRRQPQDRRHVGPAKLASKLVHFHRLEPSRKHHLDCRLHYRVASFDGRLEPIPSHQRTFFCDSAIPSELAQGGLGNSVPGPACPT